MCPPAGSQITHPMDSGRKRQKIWQSMRIMRQFTVKDLAATAECSAGEVRRYVRGLRSVGYVRIVKPKTTGGSTGGSRWAVHLLVKDTGPYAPRVRMDDKGVTDPNRQPQERKGGDRDVTVPRKDYDRALVCVKACQGMLDPIAEVAELRRRAEGQS